jgi:hypothetical protein
MEKQFTLLIIIICLFAMTGCITTNVKGYTDTDYQKYAIKKVIVRAPNAGFEFGELLEKSMVEELEDEGIKAQTFIKIFPPTREWTNDQVAEILLSEGFDTIMYINLAGSNSSSSTVGYINNGNASVYGNSASFNSYSTPVVTFNRYTETRIKVYFVKSGKIIWVGDTSTKAGGLAYMGDTTTTNSIAEDVVNSLKGNGHL